MYIDIPIILGILTVGCSLVPIIVNLYAVNCCSHHISAHHLSCCGAKLCARILLFYFLL